MLKLPCLWQPAIRTTENKHSSKSQCRVEVLNTEFENGPGLQFEFNHLLNMAFGVNTLTSLKLYYSS